MDHYYYYYYFVRWTTMGGILILLSMNITLSQEVITYYIMKINNHK